MIDLDLHALSDFRRDVPYPDSATADRIHRLAVAKHPARPLRTRTFVALAAAALVIAGGSIAAIKEVPWWQSGSPPVDPQMVAMVARDNMPATVDVADARTVAQDGNAALVAVPLDKTGYCLIPALDGRANLGAQCEYQVLHPQQGDDDRTESIARSGNWIVYGRITDPRAARIDLGPFSVALKTGGFFVARVPEDKWRALGGAANAGRILDSSGATLRNGCVNWGPAPAKPEAQLGGVPLWSDGSGPCKPIEMPSLPVIDLGDAKKLFDVTLTHPYSIWKAGTTISFVDAPATDGTRCVTADGPGLTLQYPNGPCRKPGAAWGDPQPFNIEISGGRYSKGGVVFYAWTITGTSDPSKHITKVELRSPSGATVIPFADNAFFGEIPETTPTVDDFPAGPLTLEGYDASGAKVASIDVSALHARSTPH